MATRQATGQSQWARLSRSNGPTSFPVRDLRCGPECRLCKRWHGPRHCGVRGRFNSWLVAFRGTAIVPDSGAIADYGAWWRQQRLAIAAVEVKVARTGRRNGTMPLRLSLSSRHQQMEQGRASPVLFHLIQLARRAAAGLRNDCQFDCKDHHSERTASRVPLGPTKVSDR